jgi:pantoate--beta-alanine ligase
VRTLRTIGEMRAALAAHRGVARIGLVPTMGAFHEGHLSLIRRARQECDVVVVSLFVNPTQFDEGRDLDAYPRDEAHDAILAGEAGVDFMFAPSPEEIYPPSFATTVSVTGVTEQLEGAHRGSAHFEGVATVVLKLFNIIAPDVAYFGQKDAQQALVVGRMVSDLNLALEIEVCPIVRERDGLAMSSRNVRLSVREREQAASLSRALQVAADLVAAGERDPSVVAEAGRAELSAAGVATDYFEVVSADTLAPIDEIDRDGPVLALVAARVGSTRLIDNRQLSTVSSLAGAAGSIQDRRN